ncbi:hypothetical protein [Oryzibacter oryziterrae]|uniref:hypothetical protein n=1 Tax=Oryzibacter oryziterrae TaxID=2766474 RepID=UPI001F2097BB|nr:hypothetical protein [Oryzibacter oryziterrae]
MSNLPHGDGSPLSKEDKLTAAVPTGEEVVEAVRQHDIRELAGRAGAFPGAWKTISNLVHDDEHKTA